MRNPLHRQSAQAQHPAVPKAWTCFFYSGLSILSTFFCAWNTWTSSGFSLSCWKQLPHFILALSTLNMALHCMGGSLVHDLPSVFLQHSLVPWESSWTQRRNLSNSSRDRCASFSFRWWIQQVVAEGPESSSDGKALVLQIFLWLSFQMMNAVK